MSNQINPNTIASEIQAVKPVMFYGGRLFLYDDGVYNLAPNGKINSIIKELTATDFSTAIRNEVRASLEGDTFKDFDELNLPAHLINLKNGLLNLNSFELENHSSQYHFTSQIDCEFDREAQCPTWLTFLSETFSDDLTKIDVLQEFFGYCLSPITNHAKALILEGEGANGKSVILNVLAGLLGADNCACVSLDQIKNEHYLATLFGKMVNISTETNTKAQIYEATFKALVSGDLVSADKKYEQPFQFKNTCKLAFAFNDAPRFDDKSHALYRRLLVIPCLNHVEEINQDRNLTEKLLKEKKVFYLGQLKAYHGC